MPHAHRWHLANDLIPDATVQAMADLGTFGATIPAEYGGLGLSVTMEDGVVKVIAPTADTPADKAGIKAGDYITHINKELIFGLTLDEAVPALLRLLERCDAIRRPERFDEVLLACECDARGRLGFEEQAYPPRARLQGALRAAQTVDSGVIARQVMQQIGRTRENASDPPAADAGPPVDLALDAPPAEADTAASAPAIQRQIITGSNGRNRFASRPCPNRR